jgi:hypothetical protein
LNEDTGHSSVLREQPRRVDGRTSLLTLQIFRMPAAIRQPAGLSAYFLCVVKCFPHEARKSLSLLAYLRHAFST